MAAYINACLFWADQVLGNGVLIMLIFISFPLDGHHTCKNHFRLLLITQTTKP